MSGRQWGMAMATYAIGDIQGCYDSLQRLLRAIRFDPDQDRLWLAGDLVNRGPKSLEVLRWARDLGDRVVAVLGNHDIHLLMRAAGVSGKKKRETLHSIIHAPDRDELLGWLRSRPLLHVEDGFAMVHAGLHPSWTIDEAATLAEGISAVLRADDWRFRISRLSSPSNLSWSGDLSRDRAFRMATGILTKIRVCGPDGDSCSGEAGSPFCLPAGWTPWFDAPGARWSDHTVVFGHWAALGLEVDDRYISLDSGCVWGGKLSAVRLEDREVFQVAAAEADDEMTTKIAV